MGDIIKSYASRSTHLHYLYCVSVCVGLAMSRLLTRRLFPAIDCFKGFLLSWVQDYGTHMSGSWGTAEFHRPIPGEC